MSSEPRRRSLLLGAGVGMLALGGCGFRPLYGRNGNAAVAAGEPELRTELAAIRIGLVPERFGQLMRRAVYQRLGQGVGGPTQARFELLLSPNLQQEGVAVQRDGTATRVRYIASANWLLVHLGPPRSTVATGLERTIEAFNVPESQYFASDSSRDAAEARLAEVLAELVVTRVAVDFRRRAAGGGGTGTTAPSDMPLQLPPEETLPLGPATMPGVGSARPVRTP